MIEKGPTKWTYEEKGAYDGQNEGNKPSVRPDKKVKGSYNVLHAVI